MGSGESRGREPTETATRIGRNRRSVIVSRLTTGSETNNRFLERPLPRPFAGEVAGDVLPPMVEFGRTIGALVDVIDESRTGCREFVSAVGTGDWISPVRGRIDCHHYSLLSGPSG